MPIDVLAWACISVSSAADDCCARASVLAAAPKANAMGNFVVWLLAVTAAEIVALVFLLAGVGKLFDRSASIQYM